jgi:thiamine biosynthesis protein ThiS
VSTLSIQLNGVPRNVPAESTLYDLLAVFDLPSQRIAIELNGEVVSRSDWPQTLVNEGDRIEVVHFVGGG